MKLKYVASLVLLLIPLGLVPSSAVEGGSSPTSARVANEDYRIAPRDYIQFQIHSQPDTTTHQRVTANGELQLPLLGTIKLAGLTVREAEIMLKERYREGGFFVSPQVILSVEQYRERYISLLGQVKNPDRVALPMEANSMGVLHAIARVGGFTRVARTDAVQILRTAPDGMEARFTLNLDEFLKPKPAAPASAEFQLEPGDVVFVPERAF